MKSLKCNEVCQVDCEYVAKGLSEREVVRTMFHHGETHHKELLEDLNEPQRQRIMDCMHNLIKEIEDNHHRLHY
jgi:predicted small metal-binding protein